MVLPFRAHAMPPPNSASKATTPAPRSRLRREGTTAGANLDRFFEGLGVEMRERSMREVVVRRDVRTNSARLQS